ncbi:uncharacterized protein LOC143290297 [Babylonia areolata]|uniref:uncharacterized protein LOC143290297 n=1 Tax=Babylonia areolata TaxID=304850 RepID=UPI003FD073CC
MSNGCVFKKALVLMLVSAFRKLRLQHMLAGLVALTLVVLVNNVVELVPSLSRATFIPQATIRSGAPPRPLVPSGHPVNYREEGCETCDDRYPLALDAEGRSSDHLLVRHLGQEKMQLYRHYQGFEPWPRLQLPANHSLPGQVPTTAHYLWCKGDLSLGFHHYLGVLSAVRLLQPVKLVFHFQRLPRLDHDMYYTWFLELKQSLPNLVLRPLPRGSPPCGSPELLDLALSFLQPEGGIFLGSNVIISRLPRDLHQRPFWFAFSPNAKPDNDNDNSGSSPLHQPLDSFDVTRGVIVAHQGFSEETKRKYVNQILTSPPECVAPETFDDHDPDSEENARCVVVADKPDIYPVGIMYADSPFGQLSRWLYYGTRSTMYPKTGEGDPIPRISHLIWFSQNRKSPYEMEFYQFLTVLSALYVGGFRHVYIHGNAGFHGVWWDRLRGENVTFVPMEVPEVVWQQVVNNPSHQSDVIRYQILHKYGGAYHDFEAMWTQRVPDWLLEYPCVATSDWAAYGEFPDGINPGVLLAKRQAPWVRYNLAAHRYYVEENFVWNAVLMSYRTYERHPDQLLFYRHLQVMCDLGICHPSWEPGFRRDINDRRSTAPFDWRRDTLVVHVTRPDPEASFVSPEALRDGSDMFADIGYNILEKSGRLKLLGS